MEGFEYGLVPHTLNLINGRVKRMETPNYIKTLLMPNGRKPQGRKAWSIDLESVWIPFFTATNTIGDTHLPPEALGAPIRLAYDADGSVRFSKTGRPITKVAKDLSDTIRMVRDNFSAGLVGYAEQVQSKDRAGYKAQVELAHKAGQPIIARDRANLDRAMKLAMERAMAEAEAEAEAKTKGGEKVPVTA
jgi:hypothetical protein